MRLRTLVCCRFNFIPTYSFNKCWLSYLIVWALGIKSGMEHRATLDPTVLDGAGLGQLWVSEV